ncbi:MAG TPA: peptide MFS transporter [Opitutaceae bacterium]
MEGAKAPQAQPLHDASGLWGHPRGLMTLYFTEMWERFSYYGMRAFLIVFMVTAASEGGLGFDVRKGTLVYGTYTMGVYLLSIPGGFLADNFLGARRSVLLGGIVIALGHFVLAVPSTKTFFAGLVLVVLGTGMLKPNISAMVGGLYAPGDARRDAGFSIFYMGINLGGFLAPFVCGYLAQAVAFKGWLTAHGFDPLRSWHWGFGAAGVGMTLGLVQYVAGSRRFSGIGLRRGGLERPWALLALVCAGTAAILALVLASDLVPRLAWLREVYLGAPLAAILWFGLRKDATGRRIAAILLFFAAATVFWAIYEQAGSTIALFAEKLTDRSLPNNGSFSLFGVRLSIGSPFPSSFFQSANTAFVLLLAPAFGWLWVKLGRRQPSSPAKFVLGLVFAALSFLLMVPAARLSAQGLVSPWWVIGLFFLQTIGELCLSPVGLSLMTKLATADFVGLALGIWFLASAYGNKLAGLLASGFTSDDPAGLARSFLTQATWTGATAVVLLALVPWIRRLMGTVK